MNFSELNVSAPEAAKRLLGCEIERTLDDGTVLRGKIVETEAYDEMDPGSHTFNGISPRNTVMFGPPGILYVYFIYGMHYCCNIVTGPKGRGEAVLIRAIEPILGEDTMKHFRNGLSGPTMTNGPAKVCQALAIDRTLNGHDLRKTPIKLIMNPALDDLDITTTKRIGLSKGVDTFWRFYVTNSNFVSKSSR